MKTKDVLAEDIQFSAGKPVPYEVYVTNDISFIESYVDEILDLTVKSYTKSGGHATVHNPDDIIGQTSVAKLVFNDKNEIIALALYKKNLGGQKRYCSVSRKEDPRHVEAVKDIIRTDIDPYDSWFWAEVSGKIEEFFKRMNGNPIPNHLVHKILRKPKKDIVHLDDDGVHYSRFLNANDRAPVEKMMFGFKNAAAADAAMNTVENYDKFKIDVNQAVHDLLEDERDVTDDDISFESAVTFISELDEMHESGCNEMLPMWKDQLLHAIARLLKEQKHPASFEREDLVDANLKLAKHLIRRMPLLEFHQIKIAELFPSKV